MVETKTSYEGYETLRLYEERFEKGDYYNDQSVDVIYEKDRWNIFYYEIGSELEKYLGDSDIEKWIFIKHEDGKAFVKLIAEKSGIKRHKKPYSYKDVFEILYQAYNGDKQVFEKIRDILVKEEFSHKYDHYY